jgi:hypothetical protein
VLALPLHLPLRPLRRQQHLTQTGGDLADSMVGGIKMASQLK